MAEAESHAVAPHAQGGQHTSIKTYINVAVALGILTAIEVATLYIPGIPNTLLVTSLLAMSVIKFFLVVGFFMHLRYDSGIMRTLFVGPLLLAIVIILVLMALFSAFILLPRVVL
jgi:cytochrome c oxidase subunit IV